MAGERRLVWLLVIVWVGAAMFEIFGQAPREKTNRNFYAQKLARAYYAKAISQPVGELGFNGLNLRAKYLSKAAELDPGNQTYLRLEVSFLLETLKYYDGTPETQIALYFQPGIAEILISVRNLGRQPLVIASEEFSVRRIDGKIYGVRSAHGLDQTLDPGQEVFGHAVFYGAAPPSRLTFASPVAGEISRNIPVIVLPPL